MEDHEVVHNLMFDQETNLKVPHKETLKRSEWWDNGALPLWITAQNQVSRSDTGGHVIVVILPQLTRPNTQESTRCRK